MAEAAPATPSVSIVVPAYNEAGRVDPFLLDLAAFLDGWGGSHEVLLVDDGSADDTRRHLDAACAGRAAWRVLVQPRNLGKGAAVQRGVREARGDAVLFLDADGATSPDQIPALLAALADAPFAIGDRHDPASRTVQPPLRRLTSWGFNRYVRILFRTGVRDQLCGFKALRREAARTLFTELSDPRWTFDVELLWRARRLGMRVATVPIRWTHRAGTKFRLLDPARMALRLLRLRLACLRPGARGDAWEGRGPPVS